MSRFWGDGIGGLPERIAVSLRLFLSTVPHERVSNDIPRYVRFGCHSIGDHHVILLPLGVLIAPGLNRIDHPVWYPHDLGPGRPRFLHDGHLAEDVDALLIRSVACLAGHCNAQYEPRSSSGSCHRARLWMEISCTNIVQHDRNVHAGTLRAPTRRSSTPPARSCPAWERDPSRYCRRRPDVRVSGADTPGAGGDSRRQPMACRA